MPQAKKNHVNIHRKGFMVVLSSPSGAGKTTLSRMLLDQDKNLRISVSATTRAKRTGEVEGVDYYFVSKQKFGEMVSKGEFLECAEVFGNSYGTPEKPVFESLDKGTDVLFDIDWQGTQQLLARARLDVVTIFILPPTMEELERRLRGRAQDSEEVVNGRMAKASHEISHWYIYDYVIVNHDLDESLKHLLSIIDAERQKRDRQQGLAEFVGTLIG